MEEESDRLLEQLAAEGQPARVVAQSPALEGTASAAGAIARVKYTHDAMIDLLLMNPGISQGQVAAHFGYSQVWVSRIFNSDAFQARLAVRKNLLIDPTIVATIDEKLATAASRALDVVIEKLHGMPTLDQALEAVSITTKSLGYGARQQNVNLQQNFVVALPAKAESQQAWAEKHGRPAQLTPGLVQMVEEVKSQEAA